MRVVQTFWSGNKDPLVDGFGWLSAQHNLMSWTLSCLSLKENYDEVVLYTDSTGHKIFSDYLQLPYTNIIVAYDNLQCPEHHWAYPKLLTYSLQEEPFIHMDGDVYLPKRLNAKIELGDLIAQNEEIGTSYYKNMMDAIKQGNILFPDFLEEELNKDSISSYNAGVIGGNDLDFIQYYCRSAFKFIDDNHLNDVNHLNINVNYNILFEQILFHALSAKHNKKVSTVFDHSIRDNGYTYQEFCDFYSFHKCDLMHIIGGHKRNDKICELLSRTLLKKYPEYHQRIIELFPHAYKKRHTQNNSIISDEDQSTSYNKFLAKLSIQWNKIPEEELLDIEKLFCNYFDFINNSETKKRSTVIKKNPYLSIYETSQEWSTEERKAFKEILNKNFPSDNFDIACIPSPFNEGYKEVFIDDLSYNILLLLAEDKLFKTLLREVKGSFRGTIKRNDKLIYDAITNNLEYLFYNKLIYIETI